MLSSYQIAVNMAGKVKNILKQTFYSLSVAVLLFGLSYLVAYRFFSKQIYDSSIQQLELYSKTVNSKLFELQPLNRILSHHPAILTLLKDEQDKQLVHKINNILLQSKHIASASEIYLLNHDGMTIASSNWQQENSFVGNNYKFRPYFEQAVTGASGQFYAVGIDSGIRGYYFSEPIFNGSEVIGVLVLKVAVDELENIIKHRDQTLMILDNYGIVFLSSNPSLLYKKTREIDQTALDFILKTKRYSGKQIGELIISPSNNILHAKLVKMRIDHRTKTYLKTMLFIPKIGWSFTNLIEEKKIITPALITSLIAVVLVMSLWYLSLAIRARHKLGVERLAFKSQLADELELRVEVRSKELKQVQDDLVQTAKLAALGQMSAAISHELSQPLTAISNYTENAKSYIQNNDLKMVGQNINYIAKLSEKMAAIIHHIKIFASKRPTEVEQISVNKVISETVWFMQSKFQRREVQLEMTLPKKDVHILANSVRIEQVLMNLISNALESMQKSSVKILNIEVSYNDDLVVIIIRDTGEGLSGDKIESIFKPFYTTKEDEHGMGIGLSISRSIIEEYDGILEAFNRPSGGARFEIKLPVNII